jgi:hypothetical protein
VTLNQGSNPIDSELSIIIILCHNIAIEDKKVNKILLFNHGKKKARPAMFQGLMRPIHILAILRRIKISWLKNSLDSQNYV